MPDNSDKKFLKYKARILAINGGTPQDPRLPYDIHVGAFRGYADGETIPAGTLLMDIIRKEFESTPVSYTISISSTGPGTVSPTGSQSVIRGGSLTVTATPNAGSQIKSFKVDGADQTSPYVFTNVQTNHTVVVEFETIPVVTHTITATVGANGSISPSGFVSVADGGSQTFTMTPITGYQIKDVKVDSASVGAVPSYTFNNVTADHTIYGEFEAIPATTYTVTASAGANGSVSPSGAQTVAEHGNITFTAAPASGYVVDAWKLDGATQSETGISFTVSNVTADHTVEVTFKTAPVTSHTITVTAGANGTISPAGPVTVSDGADQIFTITANSGYEIEDVKADGVSVGAVPDYTFTNVTADHTISATFKVIPVTTYTVTPSAGTGGSISPNTAQTVNSGGSVTFTATPNTGYKVKDWKLDGTSQSETGTTFTVSNVTADHTVAVEFEVIPSGNIYNQAYTNAGGRVWVPPTAENIVLGTPVADPAAAMAQIKAGTFAWTSKSQSKSIETFLIAKSLGRVTSIMSALGEMLGNAMDEMSLTIDGVDYWVYYNTSTVGAGGGSYTITGTEA